jgi:hypothetical protein
MIIGIIKITIAFIVTFICFNQGMNDLLENLIPTRTNITIIVSSVAAITIFTLNEIFVMDEKISKKSKGL